MCLIVSYYIDQLVSLSTISFAIPSLTGVKKVGKVSLSLRTAAGVHFSLFLFRRAGVVVPPKSAGLLYQPRAAYVSRRTPLLQSHRSVKLSQLPFRSKLPLTPLCTSIQWESHVQAVTTGTCCSRGHLGAMAMLI